MNVLSVSRDGASEEVWADFLSRNPGLPPIGGPEWKAVLHEAYGCELECLIARGPEHKPAGTLAFHIAKDIAGRRRLFSAPWGMVCESDIVAAALARAATDIARERGCVAATISSGTSLHRLPYRHRIRQTFVFDLTPDTETVWARLRSKTRNSIRHGQKSGLKVVRGWRPLKDFFRVYSARMTEKSVPFHNFKYFQAAAEMLGPRGEIFAAYRNDRVEAAMLVVYGRQIASYNWGAVNPGAESVRAGQFLLWEIVRACVERGLRSLDLGESAAGSGTHSFKTEFGAQPLDVHYYDLLSANTGPAVGGSPSSTPSPRLSFFGRTERWVTDHLPAAARSKLLMMQCRGTRLF